jgi:hypothetical protein
MTETQPFVVVAQGGLPRLKEMLRALEQHGVGSRVLPPEDGCLNK